MSNRVDAINRASIERGDKDQSDVDRRKTRSSQPSFNFKTKCCLFFFLWKRGQHTEKLTKASSGVLSKYKEINKSLAESIKSRNFDIYLLFI